MASEVQQVKELALGIAGETLAVQSVLICIVEELVNSGIVPRDVIERALSKADLIAEGTALRAGKQSHPVHTAQYLEVIRYMRAEILGQ